MSNLSPAILKEFRPAGDLTVTRYAAGSYSAGEYVRGAPTVFTVPRDLCSVQPHRVRRSQVDQAVAHQGGSFASDRQKIVVYTTVELRSRDEVVIPDGSDTWEVEAVDRWVDKGLPHFKATLVNKVKV